MILSQSPTHNVLRRVPSRCAWSANTGLSDLVLALTIAHNRLTQTSKTPAVQTFFLLTHPTAHSKTPQTRFKIHSLTASAAQRPRSNGLIENDPAIHLPPRPNPSCRVIHDKVIALLAGYAAGGLISRITVLPVTRTCSIVTSRLVCFKPLGAYLGKACKVASEWLATMRRQRYWCE